MNMSMCSGNKNFTRLKTGHLSTPNGELHVQDQEIQAELRAP